MNLVRQYALGKTAFAAAALVAPGRLGQLLAGEGATTPDARAFLRGMGGRELGIVVGLWSAIRRSLDVRPWLVAGVLADAGDVVGVLGAWRDLDPHKRVSGGGAAAAAMISGLVLLGLERE